MGVLLQSINVNFLQAVNFYIGSAHSINNNVWLKKCTIITTDQQINHRGLTYVSRIAWEFIPTNSRPDGGSFPVKSNVVFWT